jgi:hypothetical protein
MKGAMAEPPDRIIRILKNNNIIIKGINQNFLLVFKKSYKSFISSIQ